MTIPRKPTQGLTTGNDTTPVHPALQFGMTVIINGQERQVPEGTTVAGLVQSLGLATGACAAEVNRELVPKRRQAEQPLREGDRVELVSLVGGG
jgi:sulfur carrier protein